MSREFLQLDQSPEGSAAGDPLAEELDAFFDSNRMENGHRLVFQNVADEPVSGGGEQCG